jgi:hypothetical protein
VWHFTDKEKANEASREWEQYFQMVSKKKK